MRSTHLSHGMLVLALVALVLPAAGQVKDSRTPLSIQSAAPVARSFDLGHADPAQVLHVSVSLPYRDPEGMQNFVDSLSDPASPTFHQFITPEEVGLRYGLSLSDVQAVTSYLSGQGIHVKMVAKNRLSILADCTVAQAEAAFGTTIRKFQMIFPDGTGNSSFFAPTGSLRVPASIAPHIVDVAGLESFTRAHPLTCLTPTQTRVLYNLAPIYNGGQTGQGRTIAISNFDGFRLTNVPLYYSQYGLPTPPGGVGSNITTVTISGGAGSGTPQGEGDLDIQMVLGMAPLCNFRIYDGGANDLIGVLTAEVNDNLSDVISESYGWSLSASTATAAHNLHLSMSAQGITYMAASGDSGTTLEPFSYPDYDPDVLMVGGSAASTDVNGNRVSEVGWNGSGGGWSTNTATFNVLPSWQQGSGVPTTVNHRLVPDVALHASGTQTSTQAAYFFYFNGSLNSGSIGTSFASPVFAGSLGVAEQKIISNGGLPANGAGKQRFGRIQDLFYSQAMRSDVWLDLTSGANGNLPSGGGASTAHAGWDYVTGLGVINFNAFVATQGTATPDFSISATPSTQTVIRGSGTSYTVNTGILNGFSGNIALTISGLPSGAGFTFTPSSVAAGSGSTLAITTASTTPAGSYPLTITGTSGALVHTTSVTLVVNSSGTPDFTIVATPSSRTVTRGNSTTYTVSIGALNGFAGAVVLSQTGAPSTVTFSPSTVAGHGASTMTVRTSRNTTRKTYTITVKGLSGSLSHTTTVSLVVH